jgi:DNA-binding transcriptional regulator YhcF (GntR family)
MRSGHSYRLEDIGKCVRALASLAKPCCMKPYPTIMRSGMGAQRAMGNRSTNRSDIVTSLCHYEPMSTDSNDRLPLYAQVENLIIDGISNGSLPPDTRLPSEDSLVEEYAVSRTPIRAAIQSLIERGLVEIRRGKGTFVTRPKITQELTELTGFVEDMQALGRHATAKVLDQQGGARK